MLNEIIKKGCNFCRRFGVRCRNSICRYSPSPSSRKKRDAGIQPKKRNSRFLVLPRDKPGGVGPRGETRRSFSTVQKKFGSLVLKSKKADTHNLRRWKNYIDNGSMLISHIKDINLEVFQMFLAARADLQIIKGITLRTWAVEVAEKHGMPMDLFRASNSWMQAFNKKFKITSRKINRFVTDKAHKNAEDIKAQSNEYVKMISAGIKRLGAHCFYNVDHTGVQKEMHSARTLEIRGTQTVEGKAQSKAALTHSVTLVPVCRADGKLLEPAYLIHPETSGDFRPSVRQTMIKPDNLVIRATKSGKMEKNQVNKYLQI